ncbi:MAG TPA: hypothetical protein VF746_02405 [Longimicrobium sp.]|jgi:hypothetical protein
MTRRTLAAALLLSLPLSSLLVACGGDAGDTSARRAIENEALERDLNLALQADSQPAPALQDVPVADEPAPKLPAFVPPPAPEPRRQAPTVRRREEPRRVERPAPAPAPEPEPARPAEPEAPRYATRTAAAGQTFAVRIDEEISALEDGAGSTFTATLSDGLTDELGRVVIPAGATVRGRVVSTEGGQLALDFTSISHEGESHPIRATVVGAPTVRRVNRTSGGETAAKVAGGGAVGAVLGRVLGGDRGSTLAGAAIGAAAGTGVAIATAKVDRVIDAGSTATIRLDGPVSVRREQ